MIKVPTTEELQQKELQKQSYIANTRFGLAQQFLNSMIGRDDIGLGEPPILVNLSLTYADELMLQMGMITKEEPKLRRTTPPTDITK